MRRVRSASWTSRSASWRRSSGSAASRRMSWLNPTIEASGLLSSWATPDTSWPIASIFWAWMSSACRRSCSVRSRRRTSRRGSPSSSTRATSTSSGNSLAVAPDADRPARERLADGQTGRALAQSLVVHLVLGEVGRLTTQQPLALGPEHPQGGLVGVDHRPVGQGRRGGRRAIPRTASGSGAPTPSSRSRRRKFASEIEQIVATRSSRRDRRGARRADDRSRPRCRRRPRHRCGPGWRRRRSRRRARARSM